MQQMRLESSDVQYSNLHEGIFKAGAPIGVLRQVHVHSSLAMAHEIQCLCTTACAIASDSLQHLPPKAAVEIKPRSTRILTTGSANLHAVRRCSGTALG